MQLFIKNMCGIYRIINIINGKCYVGKSIDIEFRWKQHLRDIDDNCLIHRAMKKYGIENFILEIVEECNGDMLNNREKYWIKYYDCCILDGDNKGYNMTVNQIHFERYFDTIKDWIDKKLIYGLGISLRKPTYEFIDMVKQIPNAVIHVINGIVSMPDLDTLAGNGLKILILGYKNLRRGESYYESHNESVLGLQEDLNRYLFPEIIGHSWFDVVSFDNLAIEQLHVKEHMSKEEWNSFFMGEDGDYTFYIDMVEGMFAKDSLSMERYPLMDNIDDMFNFLRNKKEK